MIVSPDALDVILRDGTALRLTTAHWSTPRGRSVRGKGLIPDVVVDGSDTQLAAALAHVRTLIGRSSK